MRFAVLVQEYVESEYLETSRRVSVTGEIGLVAAVDKRVGQNDRLDNDIVDFVPYSRHVVPFVAESMIERRYPAIRIQV